MKKYIYSLFVFLLLGCSDSNEIQFQKDFEPSGITLCGNKTYLISDEGSLAIIDKGHIEYITIKEGSDYEGITCGGNSLYIVEEGKDNILKITKDGQILDIYDIKRSFKGQKVIDKKGDGFESLSFYKETEKYLYFFTSNQSDDFYGNDRSAILLIKINKKKKKGVIEKYYPMRIPDISAIQYKKNEIYFLSDDLDKVYKADLNLTTIESRPIGKGVSQEGLFIDGFKMHIADDEGSYFIVDFPF